MRCWTTTCGRTKDLFALEKEARSGMVEVADRYQLCLQRYSSLVAGHPPLNRKAKYVLKDGLRGAVYRKVAWLRWCCQVDRSRLCLQWCASLADALLNIYNIFAWLMCYQTKGKCAQLAKTACSVAAGRQTLTVSHNLLADELLKICMHSAHLPGNK